MSRIMQTSPKAVDHEVSLDGPYRLGREGEVMIWTVCVICVGT
jgi:hypothetical protein